MFRKTLAFVLAFAFFAVPSLAFAQEDLSETYTSADGSLVFMHPAEWVVEGFGPFALMSNDPEFSNAGEFDTVPSGTVFAVITASPWTDLGPEVNLSGDVTATAIAEAFLDDPTAPEMTEGPTELDIDRDAVFLIGEQDGNELLVVIIVIDNTNGLLFVGGTAAGEMGQHRDTLLAIASSATYTPPDPNAGSVAADTGPASVAGTGAVA